jgi:hypothetical protein
MVREPILYGGFVLGLLRAVLDICLLKARTAGLRRIEHELRLARRRMLAADPVADVRRGGATGGVPAARRRVTRVVRCSATCTTRGGRNERN